MSGGASEAEPERAGAPTVDPAALGASASPADQPASSSRPSAELAPKAPAAPTKPWAPPADRFERGLWAVLSLGCLTVLGIAWWLDPAVAGHGTHEQLGLPPCGLVEMINRPCPSCGFTTCFTLGMDGRWIDSAINQPFGFLLYLVTLSVPFVGARVVFQRFSVLHATRRWPWWSIIATTFALWLLAWLYKWLTWPA